MYRKSAYVRDLQNAKEQWYVKFYFVKKTNLQQFKFCLIPEDENSTRQTGRETYDFHSSGECQTRIDEWASDKWKPCCMVILLSLLARITTGNVPENISVDIDELLQKTKETEKTKTTIQLQIVLERKKLKQFSLANLGLGSCQSREGCKTKKTKELRDY